MTFTPHKWLIAFVPKLRHSQVFLLTLSFDNELLIVFPSPIVDSSSPFSKSSLHLISISLAHCFPTRQHPKQIDDIKPMNFYLLKLVLFMKNVIVILDTRVLK